MDVINITNTALLLCPTTFHFPTLHAASPLTGVLMTGNHITVEEWGKYENGAQVVAGLKQK